MSPIEILEQLRTQLRENILSRTRVSVWHKELSGGHEEVHDRRPENIEAVCRLIEENRQISLLETSTKSTLGTGVSKMPWQMTWNFEKSSLDRCHVFYRETTSGHRLKVSHRLFGRFQQERETCFWIESSTMKKVGWSTRSRILLDDNARLHVANATNQKLGLWLLNFNTSFFKSEYILFRFPSFWATWRNALRKPVWRRCGSKCYLAPLASKHPKKFYDD